MITKNQERDYKKFLIPQGDIGFNPKRNKTIIDEVIKENEVLQKRKEKQYVDKLRYRTDAVASYLKKLASGSTIKVETYFGRKELAKLRGQKIVAEIKDRATKLLEVN